MYRMREYNLFYINIETSLFFLLLRSLQEKLEQPVTGPPSPRDINNGDTAQNLTSHIDHLRAEVNKLKKQLYHAQVERE